MEEAETEQTPSFQGGQGGSPQLIMVEEETEAETEPKHKPSFQGGQGGSPQSIMVEAETEQTPSFQGGQGGSPTYRNANPLEYGLLKVYARENRKNQTDSESILWSQIRGKALGVTFLRQYIIGDYITDFACLNPKLVIEVDGGYHSEPRQAEDDAIRQKWLEKQGFKVIRFTNAEVECDIENTVHKIKDALSSFPPFKEG